MAAITHASRIVDLPSAHHIRLWTREEYYKMADTYDRTIKASLYASASIPEYWVLNLVDQRLEVSRDPIAMPGQPYGYGYRTCADYLAADAVTPLAAGQRSVTVADLLP